MNISPPAGTIPLRPALESFLTRNPATTNYVSMFNPLIGGLSVFAVDSSLEPHYGDLVITCDGVELGVAIYDQSLLASDRLITIFGVVSSMIVPMRNDIGTGSVTAGS